MPLAQTKRISEKVMLARHQRFVGRQAEVELFRLALTAEEAPFVVLHIFGPGGVGKTTLLHELARLAVAHGRFVIHLDGHHLEPNPPAFVTAVQQAAASSGDSAVPPNTVLILDTFEMLAPLDAWLRDKFLADLPEQTLIIIAGRHAPANAWVSDSGWASLTRIISLNNLRREEGQTYLSARGVPAEQHAAVLNFTHGHPLALSLMADLYQQNAASAPTLVSDERDIIHILLERFLRDVPTVQHRQALELCVIMRTTTEALLLKLADPEMAFVLFQWLRQLSFMEQGPFGLFPHDLVREVLEADLYWRNPNQYVELQKIALTYLRREVLQAQNLEKQRRQMDVIYINRRYPEMRPFFVWDVVDTVYAQTATPDSFPAVLDMVRWHEGEQSARIARHWQQRQPEAFLTYHTSSGELYGFMMQLALHRVTAEDAMVDPAVQAALPYVQVHHPVQPDEAMSYLRYWMARETYQAVSPALNATAANCVIHWRTTPRLVWSFVSMANPDFMAPHFESIHFWRTPAADFRVGEQSFGLFSHNWLVEPVDTWRAEPPRSGIKASPATTVSASSVTLSQTDFTTAVRQALRDYTRPDRLAANPLCRTRLLPSTDQTPEALQVILRQAVDSLKHNPKDAKLYRALWHTYFEPEATQEKTAERLDLPFNTYRYHLAAGLDRLIAWLWYHAQSPSA